MKKPTTKRAKIFMSVWSVLTLCVVCFSTTAFATGGDPITVVNNLSSVCRSRAMTPASDPRASCACSAGL